MNYHQNDIIIQVLSQRNKKKYNKRLIEYLVQL